MSGAPSPLAELLADCDAHGIRLLVADDDGLTIDAPQVALTPDLLDRLRAYKGQLVALLRPARNEAPALFVSPRDAPAKPTETGCRCGATAWRDVPIHNGQSVRRDCGRCGRFIDFPVWYGKKRN